MTTWKDSTGREWTLDLNVTAIKRIKGLTGVNLGRLDGEILTDLSEDPILLCDVLYAAHKPCADAAGVDSEAFGTALAGDVIGEATTALLAELANFIRSPRRRSVVRLAMQRIDRIEAINLETMETAIAEMATPEAEAAIASAAATALRATMTRLSQPIDSAESSELTPAP